MVVIYTKVNSTFELFYDLETHSPTKRTGLLHLLSKRIDYEKDIGPSYLFQVYKRPNQLAVESGLSNIQLGRINVGSELIMNIREYSVTFYRMVVNFDLDAKKI